MENEELRRCDAKREREISEGSLRVEGEAKSLAPHGDHEGHGRPRSEEGRGVEIGRCRGTLDMSLFRALVR